MKILRSVAISIFFLSSSSEVFAALSLSDIAKSAQKFSDVRKTKTLYFEPYLGVNWNKWSEQVDGNSMSGNIGGQ